MGNEGRNMHYDEQRENDITDDGKNVIANVCNKSANKNNVILPYSSSINQHLTIIWHLDELVNNGCVNLANKLKENI